MTVPMLHWREYLAEALGLGLFMVSAGLVATALDSPLSPVHEWIGSADLRRVLAGIAMGLTAIGLIHSPWGKRSGGMGKDSPVTPAHARLSCALTLNTETDP